MKPNETASAAIVAMTMVLLVGALVLLSPHSSSLLIKSLQDLNLQAHYDATLIARVARHFSMPATTRTIISSQLPLHLRPPLFASMTTLTDSREAFLNIEPLGPFKELCPPSFIVEEPVIQGSEEYLASSRTCRMEDAIEVTDSALVRGNLTTPSLSMLSLERGAILVTGTLLVRSLVVQGNWIIITGGDVSILELELHEGADLLLHSAHGNTTIQNARGAGAFSFSSGAGERSEFMGIRASSLKLPLTATRVLSLTLVGQQ